MEIEYLKRLSTYPTVGYKNTDYVTTLKPISLEEINDLENTYNNGNAFPKALKELLFLAGNNCHVLDNGLNDSQQEMQEEERSYMVRKNMTITRPFFVIDVYNSISQFLFIYLDEGDDPEVYEAVFSFEPSKWIYGFEQKLSEFIDWRLTRLLRGENPF